MREFSDLSLVLNLDKPPISLVGADLYQIQHHPYQKCKYDWGMICVYHFKDSDDFKQWSTLTSRIHELITQNRSLNVEMVPIYEIGADFVIQCKPPYDGGYSTSKFSEYVNYADCRPDLDFLPALFDLYTNVSLYLPQLNCSDRRLIHSQLIKPNNWLYWGDESWSLYLPTTDLTYFDY